MSTDESSELERLRAELAELRSRFHLLVESSAEAMYLKDADSRYVYVNPAAAAMMFRRPEELIGASDDGVFEPDVVQEIRADDERVMRTRQTAAIRTARVMGDGVALEYDTVKRPWVDEAGHIQGVIGVTSEVSELAALQRVAAQAAMEREANERREVEGQLRRADRLVSAGVLAGSLVHEIRNPLAFVLAATREAHQASTVPAEAARLADIVDAAERIEGIISAASGLARADHSGLGAIDVEAAIDRAILLAGARMRGGASVHRTKGGVPAVLASDPRLVQVLLNLLVNAAQAIEESGRVGTIGVSTGIEGGAVVVRVHDTGPGVPSEVAQRLFKPFSTTKAGDEGAGLGLWVSHGIVHEFGGALELENPGQLGASFVVRLKPAENGASEKPKDGFSNDGPAAGESPLALAPARLPRLLLVDDEVLIRGVIEEGLEASFVVVSCGGVSEALSRLEAGDRFDLVLCDLVMPDGGGARLHAELRRFAPASPILFMSGGAPSASARDFLAREGIEPIQKPFRLGALRRRLLEAIPGAH